MQSSPAWAGADAGCSCKSLYCFLLAASDCAWEGCEPPSPSRADSSKSQPSAAASAASWGCGRAEKLPRASMRPSWWRISDIPCCNACGPAPSTVEWSVAGLVSCSSIRAAQHRQQSGHGTLHSITRPFPCHIMHAPNAQILGERPAKHKALQPVLRCHDAHCNAWWTSNP